MADPHAMVHGGGGRPAGGRVGTIGAALLYMAAALLILATIMPPVMDFPNHLARIWLLGGGAEQAPMNQFYEVRWAQASTNVAVDYVAAALARVLPLFILSKLLLLVIFLGPPMAATLLMRRLFGRFDAWSAIVLPLAWTTTSVAGFMSYQFAITGALLGAAAITSAMPEEHGGGGRGRGVLFGLHLPICTVLLAIHPFGLLFYLALFAGLALGWSPWSAMPQRLVGAVRLIVPAALIAAVPMVLLFTLAPSPPRHVSAVVWQDITPGTLVRTLLSPIASYNIRIDAVFATVLAMVVGLLAWCRRLRVHGGLLLVGVALTGLSLVMPSVIGDASWLQRRLPLMSALTLFVALHPALRSRGEHRALAAALLALGIARIGWITSVWLPRDRDARALIAAARIIPPGSSVLLLRTPDTRTADAPPGRVVAGDPYWPEPTSRHLGALLVPTRHVLVPTLFAIPGQHAIRVRPSWASHAIESSVVPQPADLDHVPPREPYLAGWNCRFDYVVVTDQDQANRQALVHPAVWIVQQTPFATIGRISRTGCKNGLPAR